MFVGNRMPYELPQGAERDHLLADVGCQCVKIRRNHNRIEALNIRARLGVIQRKPWYVILLSFSAFLSERFHDYRLAGSDWDIDFSLLGDRSQLGDCFAFQVFIAVLPFDVFLVHCLHAGISRLMNRALTVENFINALMPICEQCMIVK